MDTRHQPTILPCSNPTIRAAPTVKSGRRSNISGNLIVPPHSSGVRLLTDTLAGPATKPAIVLPESGARITYDALRQQVEEMADALAHAGVRRGDRVAMALPNGLPAIVCFLAAATAGTAAPLNPAYKEDEFRFYLEDTGAQVLLLPADGAAEARRAAEGRIRILTVETTADGGVRLSDVSGRHAGAAPSPDDDALILHTSGSTGRPKRVPLTHANLTISVENIVNTYALTADDVSLCVMPLFHVHGLVASTLATLASGGTVVVPAKFSPLSFWRVARDHGATWYSAVPTLHQILLARIDRGGGRPVGAERLRFIRSCSAALPPRVMHDLEAAIGVPVLEAYGMTEAAHQMASNPLPPGERRAGSVGRGTDVKISIMDEEGHHLPAGAAGEVVIQGPNVTRGYENNPEANAAAFTEGWFRTGDKGVLDARGYLTLIGRLKELINRGGEKVAPQEIDEVLLAHPAVAEAVAFGVSHETWGEEVAAAVVLRPPNETAAPPTESDLVTYCRERLADFKRPKRIYIVAAIPRTATGKIQRRTVAARYAQTTS
jgi:acyl-CoA synthetase (AMP-forming)/AMP-acid ligase II